MCLKDYEGYPVWLCRDLRTVKVPQRKQVERCKVPMNFSKFSYCHRRHITDFSLSLQELVTVVCVCFVALGVRGTMSAPVYPEGSSSSSTSSTNNNNKIMGITFSESLLKLTSCGGTTTEQSEIVSTDPISQEDLIKILHDIRTNARRGLDYAHSFSEKYVWETFQSEYSSHRIRWREQKLSWMPSSEDIPKELGEDITSENLLKIQEAKINKTLVLILKYLQMAAVGLEQVYDDKKNKENENFTHEFFNVRQNSKLIICEIASALVELDPTIEIEDVVDSAFIAEVRNVEDGEAYRHLRDWLIFRDYMNCLEYIVAVCDHFIILGLEK